MDLEVDRQQLTTVRLVDAPPAQLQPGQARLRVDKFALTSNNITYAVFGDMMNYWDFFPANPAADDVLWGRVPVWGFGDVVESTVGELVEGTRVYGYLPMSDELIVEPGRFDEGGFSDLSAHRAPMAAAYNRYAFCEADPGYSVGHEAHQMVLSPLFFTSFMIDDLLDDSALLTGSVVISSASAKTAIGVAFLLSRRDGVNVVGLTSERNADFVRELGCYDQVVTYDSMGELPGGPAAYVDIAGDSAVTRAVHEHFGSQLMYSMIVGGTHWNGPAPEPGGLPGPTPEFFFAPTQIAKRNKDWGRDGFASRTSAAWTAYREWTDGWLHMEQAHGGDAVKATFLQLLAGDVDPRVGYVCQMGAE